ncbi:hypothetical protein ASU35_05990 [Acetivibrio ethanolgignens]|uniref:Phage protein n=2 Tax=Acetivibrio ethanolgignens TaxID=290052 RepID=A0A0V8QIG6_9FIRM|nr:hypothetical protein [Acetivibrio ethanolgignens]KSV60300.1 hypothetical protein ASU35_05990 [Acetivibrio ethanolgignens]
MNAEQLHRKAVESRYTGICNVYEQKAERNEVTKLMEQKEVLVLENQPCRISFSSVPSASEKQNAAKVDQIVTLFIAPELEIKAGSKIVITQDNVTREYSKSGISAVYPSHQEITLELLGGYA